MGKGWEAWKGENQTPKQRQNQFQGITIAIWFLVLYHWFLYWWIICLSRSTKWSWSGFWAVQTTWWVPLHSPQNGKSFTLHPKIASTCKNKTFLLWLQIFYPLLFYQSLWAKILHCAYVVGFTYIHIYLYLPLSLSPPLHSITPLLEGGKMSTSVYCRGLSHLFLSSLEHLGDWFWSVCLKLIAIQGFTSPSYVGMLSQPTREGWLLFAWQICVVNSFGSFSTFTKHSTQKLIQANWNPWANPFCVTVVSRGVTSWDLEVRTLCSQRKAFQRKKA